MKNFMQANFKPNDAGIEKICRDLWNEGQHPKAISILVDGYGMTTRQASLVCFGNLSIGDLRTQAMVEWEREHRYDDAILF